jgi:hypothetical protein
MATIATFWFSTAAAVLAVETAILWAARPGARAGDHRRQRLPHGGRSTHPRIVPSAAACPSLR